MLNPVLLGQGVDEDLLERLLKAMHQNGFFQLRGNVNKFEVRHNRFSAAHIGDRPGTLKPVVSLSDLYIP